MVMILAIDYGQKRIGLALGSVIPRVAGVIDNAQKRELVLEQIKTLCLENDVEKIVIGLPIRSQGEEGTHAQEIRNFSAQLEKATGLLVLFEEEQFTSTEAERLLGKINEKERRAGKVDEMAALLILEQYLNHSEGSEG